MWQLPWRFSFTGRSWFDTEDHPHRVVIDLDAFDQSANQLALGRPIGSFQSITDHIREEAHLADHQLQRADFLGRSLQSNRLRFQRADPPAQFQDAGLELLAGDEALRVAGRIQVP
jgi:hypothetical protein